MSNFKDSLHSIIAKHTNAAVNEAVAAYKEIISVNFGPSGGGKSAKAGPGRRVTVGDGGAKGRGGRRSSKQISRFVTGVHAFISHPGLRTEQIMAKMGGDRASLKDALSRLRSDKKVKTKGIKRAMTYTAA